MNVVKNFFKNQMEMVHDIHLHKAIRVGKGKDRPILISLANPSDKGTIFANVKNLQGKKGVKNRPYRIENHLTANEKEKRKKIRDFKWRNKQSTAEQVAMSV